MTDRDLKLKNWLLDKDLREKALELMARLDTKRADDEESLKEVGIASLAIDRLLGNDTDTKKSDPNDETNDKQKKTLKKWWVKWLMEHHSFSNVKLSDEDLNQFTGGVKELLDKEKDDGAGEWIHLFPSLKYSFPAVPKNGEKPRPMSNDQKLQNAIFLRCAQSLWRKIKSELNDRIAEVTEF